MDRTTLITALTTAGYVRLTGGATFHHPAGNATVLLSLYGWHTITAPGLGTNGFTCLSDLRALLAGRPGLAPAV